MLLKKLAKVRRAILWCAVFAVSGLAFGATPYKTSNLILTRDKIDALFQLETGNSTMGSAGVLTIDTTIGTQGQCTLWHYSPVPKAGYHFTSWSFQDALYNVGSQPNWNAATTVSDSDIYFGFATSPAYAPIKIKLTANYQANTYTIKFNANGGSGTMANESMVYGTAKALTANAFKRTGYSFAGWSTSASGSVKYADSQSVSNLTSTNKGTFNLYAVWTANTYTITYTSNGGTLPSGARTSYTYGTSVALPTPTRAGYTFNGWSLNSDLSGTLYTAISATMSGNKTFYAKWTPKTYNVVLNRNDGSEESTTLVIKFDEAKTLPSIVDELKWEQSGYSNPGWSTSPTSTAVSYKDKSTVTNIAAVDSTLNLYVVWVAKKYTLTFNAQGGTVATTTKEVTFNSTYGNFPGPTRVGYTFEGWYNAPQNGAKISSADIVDIAADQTMYAYWTANSYTLTFNSNNGDAPIPLSQVVVYDSPYGDLASCTRTGYTFAGWYTSSFGGDRVTSESLYKTTSNQTLYAHWTAKKFTVSFEPNGGDAPSKETIEISYASTYGELPTCTRTGYNFEGWYTLKDEGSRIVSSTEVTALANQTLYAHWSPKKFTVTFDRNGGSSVSFSSLSVTYDSTYEKLPSSTRDGYTFVGWYTDSVNGSKVEATDRISITANQTLYAHWSANSYTLSFNSNNGDVPTPGSKTIIYDSPYGDLASCTRSGYEFAGWYTTATGGAEIKSTTKVTSAEDQMLYAHWTAKQYTVSFEANGGDTPSKSELTVTYDSTYYSLPSCTRTGYTFQGWYTAAVDGTKIDNSTKVTITAAQTLYAHWSAKPFTVYFNANGGGSLSKSEMSVTYDSTYGELATCARTGYTFAGWYTYSENGSKIDSTSKVAITSNQTLYAHWTANEYIVSFNANGGEEPSKSSITVTYDASYGELPTCTREGYTFAGWYTAAEAGNRVYDTTRVSITEAQTLFAHWTAKTFTISYEANGATPTAATKTVTYDKEYGSLLSISRTGYKFDGWFTASSEGDQIFEATIVKLTENQTLYAHWTAESYTVSFDANGGNAPSKAAMTATYDSTYGELAECSRVGYTFEGWYTYSSGGTKIEAENTVTITKDQILYAHWKANQYAVSFEANGGDTPSQSEITVTYDSTYYSLPSCTRTGYTFQGWYTAAVDGTKIDNSTKVTITAAQTLYAHWSVNSYNVSFNANGGSLQSSSSKTVTYDSTYGDLATCSRIGYAFVGWFTSDIDGVEITSETKVEITKSQTLYAHWSANYYTVSFNANGGDEPSESSKSVTYDSTYGDLPTCTRTGYTFAGWYPDPSNGYRIEAATKVGITEDSVLYAHWTANEYTIEFDVNGGKALTSNTTTVKYDSNYGYLPRPDKTGYDFAGWFTAREEGTKIETTTKVTITENSTLFAHWTPKSFTVTFYSNGGATPTPDKKTVTYDSTYGELSTCTRVGYAFVGWFTSSGEGAEITAETKVAITANQSLYAHWKAIDYKVSFNANGGDTPSKSELTVTYDSTYGELPTCTRTGYNFAGWYTAAEAGNRVDDTTRVSITQAQTLYAHWTARTFTLSYDANGATPTTTTKTVTYDKEYGSLHTITRAGYKFIGWFTAAEEGEQVFETTIVSKAEDHTLYAHWSPPIKYTIRFDANAGSAATGYMAEVRNVEYDKTITLPTNAFAHLPDKDEKTEEVLATYLFMGWATSSASGAKVVYEDGAEVSNLCNEDGEVATLYAVWKVQEKFKVTVTKDDGVATVVSEPSNLLNPIDSWTKIKVWGIAKAGYVIDYDEEHPYIIESLTKDETVKLTATPITYTIHFNANGGEGAMADMTVTYDTKPTIQNRFSMTNMRMIGWARSADGEVVVNDGRPITNLTSINGDIVELYAIWAEADPINDYTLAAAKLDAQGKNPAGTYFTVTPTKISNNTLDTWTIEELGSYIKSIPLIRLNAEDKTIDFEIKDGKIALNSTIAGTGTLSFKYKIPDAYIDETDFEEGDGIFFYIEADGTKYELQRTANNWKDFSVSLTDVKSLSFVVEVCGNIAEDYLWDIIEYCGGDYDRLSLDDILWSTGDDPTPPEKTELEQWAELLGCEEATEEAVAAAKTAVAAELTLSITIDSEGKPVVTMSGLDPDKPYASLVKIEGSNDITDPECWTDCTDDPSPYHFFRATLDLGL